MILKTRPQDSDNHGIDLGRNYNIIKSAIPGIDFISFGSLYLSKDSRESFLVFDDNSYNDETVATINVCSSLSTAGTSKQQYNLLVFQHRSLRSLKFHAEIKGNWSTYLFVFS